jgi:hypothetical protein
MSKKSKSLKKGKISVLKIFPYRGIAVYIRKINEDIFEYLIPYKDEIYSAYNVITPEEGKTKMNKKQIVECAGYCMVQAQTTIDYLLDKKDKAN